MKLQEAAADFFRSYAAAFSKGDARAITGFWAFPAFVTTPQGNAAFEDPERFEANTTALCAFYSRQGLTKVEAETVSINELHQGIALVKTHYRLYGNQDSLIVAWMHTYLIRHERDDIKLITAIADGELAAWEARGTPLGSR